MQQAERIKFYQNYDHGRRLPVLASEIKEFLHLYCNGLGYPQKMGIIKEISDEETSQFTCAFAELLQKLQGQGRIYDWFPTKANSMLDFHKVDFLIEVSKNIFVAIQVTSSPKRGTDRRKGIRNFYGLSPEEKLPVAVITMRSNKNTQILDEEILIAKIIAAIAETPSTVIT